MRSNRWVLAALAPLAFGSVLTITGCGSTTPAPTTTSSTPPPQGNEDSEAHQHRNRHAGGMIGLIAMSIKELDLTPEQKAKVEAIRADLHAKMEPAHAAGKELAGVLAEGVAAGAVDRAKADAAIDKLVSAVEAIHAASQDALNQLHAALTPPQRAAFVDKLQARSEKWTQAHGGDEHGGGPGGPGGSGGPGGGPDHHGPPRGAAMGFGRDLGLTDDQKEKIKSNLHEMMSQGGGGGTHGPGMSPGGGPGGPPDHHDMHEHMQAFATAFKSDTFDAKSLDSGSRRAGTHMARFGATHMARWCEAAAPVLTPEQRTKLAQSIRDHAGKKD